MILQEKHACKHKKAVEDDEVLFRILKDKSAVSEVTKKGQGLKRKRTVTAETPKAIGRFEEYTAAGIARMKEVPSPGSEEESTACLCTYCIAGRPQKILQMYRRVSMVPLPISEMREHLHNQYV